MEKIDIEELKFKAEAGAKTIEVLKNKVLALYNGGAETAIQKQLESSKRRDEENRRKRELMEVRNQELNRHAETLEAKVESRTNAIKTILNNVKFGFFVIDRELKIGAEYTKTCEELFGIYTFAGISVLDIFGLNPRSREHFQLGVDQVFEDLMPSEVSLSQLPSRFQLNGRVLRAEGSVIRENGMVVGILYTVSDISALEKAQREANNNRVLIGILRQKDAFQDFVTECYKLIESSQKIFSRNDQQSIRRVIHTLKGNCASWELNDIAIAIHEIEENEQIVADHFVFIRHMFEEFLATNKTIVGISFEPSAAKTYEINSNKMHELQSIASSLKLKDAALLNSWTAQVLLKPAFTLLGPLDDFVARLADRLHKEIDFKVFGHETLIDVDLMRGPFQNLIHLLRNAIDHGIESPEARGSKELVGKLYLTIAKSEKFFSIKLEDDGRGIDTDKLVDKVLAKNLMSREAAEKLTHQQRVDLIFLDNVSSTDAVTDISGRGMGMSAMLEAVRHSHGTIAIESVFGKGTTMVIQVPIPEVLKLRALDVA